MLMIKYVCRQDKPQTELKSVKKTAVECYSTAQEKELIVEGESTLHWNT